MKKTKRILAIIMAVIMGFCSLAPTAYAEDSKADSFGMLSKNDYVAALMAEGYPAMSTAQFANIVEAFTFAFRIITGRALIPQRNFNVVLADDMLVDICDYLFENTGLDIERIATSLPETNQYSELLVKAFKIDTVAFRESTIEKSDELFKQGKTLESYFLRWIGVYMSIIDECAVYGEPVDGKDGIFELVVKITYRDSSSEVMRSGILVDTATGQIYGENGDGMLGIGYNYSIQEMMVYAPVNVWMRQFGFCLFYDIFSYSTPFFNYNTRRIKFDYDGLEWMVQIWKGNYLVANGGEVGLYNRKPGSIGTFYNCANDEQMLKMTLEIYHEDKLLIGHEPQMHWWLNGFQISDTLYVPKSLTMKFSLEMKDKEMLSAFCNAVDKHYRHDMTYTVDGLTVSVVW